MGTLYLVATPIGNLEDITLRALSTLRQASLIAAEDTRQTQKLLARYEIHVPLVSYHEYNKLSRVEEILGALAMGDVALVSDAGTPGLNDPGYELVQAALEAGFHVSPIPGPAAPVAALVVSGLPTDAFLYLGYLPRRPSERRQRLEEVAQVPYTLVFLETPHRLMDALQDIENILGDRPVAVAREMTKLHEEIFRGTVRQASEHFTQNSPRGEFTLVVGGRSGEEPQQWSEAALDQAIQLGMDSGRPQSQLAGEIAQKSGWQRRDVYRRIVERKKRGED